MGCCNSTEKAEEKQRSQEIDADIKRARVNMRREIKMLLLGK
jgi:guanine nucleotide-binding protein subunit alpha